MIPVEIVDLSDLFQRANTSAPLTRLRQAFPLASSPYIPCYWAPADTHEGLVHYISSCESNIGSREERTCAEGT